MSLPGLDFAPLVAGLENLEGASFDEQDAIGVVANPGAQTRWNQNDTLVYRFTVTLQNNTGAQGLTSTTGFTWEARNQ